MRVFLKWGLFALACSLLFQGCAGNMQLAKKDLESLNIIKVVRYKTPDLQVKTLAGVILYGPVGVYIDSKASEEARQKTVLPDFGDLLARRFAELVKKEINGWPEMLVEEKPLEYGHKYKEGNVILFQFDQVWLTIRGLGIAGNITMKNSSGDTIFKRQFFYRSRDFNLKRSLDEYLADNCKLLREEMPVAADYTAKDLIIKYLKKTQ